MGWDVFGAKKNPQKFHGDAGEAEELSADGDREVRRRKQSLYHRTMFTSQTFTVTNALLLMILVFAAIVACVTLIAFGIGVFID